MLSYVIERSIRRLGQSDTNEWLKNNFFLNHLFKKSSGTGQKSEIKSCRQHQWCQNKVDETNKQTKLFGGFCVGITLTDCLNFGCAYI